MTTAQTCPRRMLDMGPWERAENLDSWAVRGGDSIGPSCSFCGSLHPDRFMELVRQGWVVGPTDKSYKAYLSQPLSDEEKAEHKSRWLDRFIARGIQESAEARNESGEQVREELSRYYDEQVAPLNESAKQTKFYYVHLSEEQQHEFIDLHNSRHMKIGYPGHFYQPPFFTQPDTNSTREERE